MKKMKKDLLNGVGAKKPAFKKIKGKGKGSLTFRKSKVTFDFKKVK